MPQVDCSSLQDRTLPAVLGISKSGGLHLELRQLRYFVMVAQLGSLSAAAQALHIAEPPLSVQIKNLERELRFLLFIRSNRGMILTPQGKVFLTKAHFLLTQLDQLVPPHDAAEASPIHIATIPSYAPVLADAMQILWRELPNIEINVYESNTAHVFDLVEEGIADLGIARVSEARKGVQTQPLFSDPFCALMQHTHRLASHTVILPHDLEQEPLYVIRNSLESNEFSQITQLFSDYQVVPHITCFAESASTVLRFVERGAGVALVPIMAQTFCLTNVVAIPFGTEAQRVNATVALTWRQSQALSINVDKMRNILLSLPFPSIER